MYIGLFFGSFNPIHKGHLLIASYFLDHTGLDEVWFVVSPQNPLKEEADLLGIAARLELVSAAIASDERMKCCDIEVEMATPSYTAHTMQAISEAHPDDRFAILMGSDNLENLHLWKDYTDILEKYEIYAYPREGRGVASFANHPSVTLFDSPLLNISATLLRDRIKKEEFDQWLPEQVSRIIRERGYYGIGN